MTDADINAHETSSKKVNWYFSVDHEGDIEAHSTEQEARAAAQAALDTALGDLWPEGMERVCWGVVVERAVEVDRKDHTAYGHSTGGHSDAVEAGSDCPVSSDVDWLCEYELFSREALAGGCVDERSDNAAGFVEPVDATFRRLIAEHGQPEGPAWDASEKALVNAAHVASHRHACAKEERGCGTSDHRVLVVERDEARAEVAAYQGRPEGALPGWTVYTHGYDGHGYRRDIDALRRLVVRVSHGMLVQWNMSNDGVGVIDEASAATPRAAMRAAENAALAWRWL